MASRIGDRNTRMGRAAAGALQQRRAGSAKLMRED